MFCHIQLICSSIWSCCWSMLLLIFGRYLHLSLTWSNSINISHSLIIRHIHSVNFRLNHIEALRAVRSVQILRLLFMFWDRLSLLYLKTCFQTSSVIRHARSSRIIVLVNLIYLSDLLYDGRFSHNRRSGCLILLLVLLLISIHRHLVSDRRLA